MLLFLGLFLSLIVPSESLLFSALIYLLTLRLVFCSCLFDSALVLLSLVSESGS